MTIFFTDRKNSNEPQNKQIREKLDAFMTE